MSLLAFYALFLVAGLIVLAVSGLLLFIIFGLLMWPSRAADIRALQDLRTRRLARERRR